MNYWLKQFIPPIFKPLRWFSFKYGWKGNFSSFDEAHKKAIGYNTASILESIIRSTKKVRDKEIPYERDGIAFDELKMNHPLLSALLMVAGEYNHELTVLDFGGSLGTTYFQNKPFLSGLKSLKWCIVEQPNYIETGKKEFETAELLFYPDIKTCLTYHSPNIIVLCNVLQYIDQAYDLLNEIKETGIPYLLIDFVGYNDGKDDRITVQYVPPVFYGVDASYPCWFFNKEKMYDFLAKDYSLVYDYIANPDKYYLELKPFQYEGQLWKLK